MKELIGIFLLFIAAAIAYTALFGAGYYEIKEMVKLLLVFALVLVMLEIGFYLMG